MPRYQIHWSLPGPQGIRRYATEGSSQGSNTAIYTVVGGTAAAAGGYYYYTRTQDPITRTMPSVMASVKASGNTAFKGGDQGFIDLKLESVENVNHNTKRFRFALPNSDDVSGLKIACGYLPTTRLTLALTVSQLPSSPSFKAQAKTSQSCALTLPSATKVRNLPHLCPSLPSLSLTFDP